MNIYISKNRNISVFMNIDSSSENCLFDFLKRKTTFWTNKVSLTKFSL